MSFGNGTVALKLSEWRSINGRTQAWVASKIAVDQGFISRIERAVNPQMPSRDVLRSIYVLTRGVVQPNDFYDVPAWEADLIRAEGDAQLAQVAA
jgi:hypothetical protein